MDDHNLHPVLNEVLQENAGLLKRCKVLEQEIQTANQFIAAMSHELRNSLGCLHGFAELLVAEHGGTEDRRQYQEAVLRNSTRLLNMVNELLDFSKLTTGVRPIRPRVFCLKELILDILSSIEMLRKEKVLSIDLKMDQGLPTHLHSDDDLIRQVLMNLMSNALKYTPSGRILLRAERYYLREGQPLIRIQVQDSGPGIEPDERELLFNPFFRGRLAVQRGLPGTGLGLLIAKRLAQALGGTLELDPSCPEGGASFSFFLPFSPREPSEREPQ